jgi:predicted DNA-binding transcriptional regulator AlpA
MQDQPGDAAVQEPLLTTAQAAELLNLKPDTLCVWRSTRRPHQPAYVKLGRAVRYRRADLESYLAARTVSASEPGPTVARR